jgi:hypothetical protein
MENNKNHSLQIDYGQGLMATAVLEVTSFNEREIKLSLASGQRLAVNGEKLKIVGFNRQCGELKLSGVIIGVRYFNSASSQFKKIFK